MGFFSKLSGAEDAKKAAKKAAREQNKAIEQAWGILNTFQPQATEQALTGYDQALGTLGDVYAQTGGMWDPVVGLGDKALTRLDALTAPGGAAYAAEDPGYQWRLQQGLDAAQNSAVAQRMGMSGNTLAALNNYAQGAASQEFGDTFNRYLQMAQMGNQGRSAKTQLGQWYGGLGSGLQVGRGATQADMTQGLMRGQMDLALAKGGVNANRELQQGQASLANSGFWGDVVKGLITTAATVGGGIIAGPAGAAAGAAAGGALGGAMGGGGGGGGGLGAFDGMFGVGQR